MRVMLGIPQMCSLQTEFHNALTVTLAGWSSLPVILHNGFVTLDMDEWIFGALKLYFLGFFLTCQGNDVL